MKNIFKKISILILTLLFVPAVYAIYDNRGPIPIVSIGKTAHPPILDGNLDDWKNAVTVSGFTLNDGKGYATQQTRVYLTYDENTLYIAYWCEEEEAANLKVTEPNHDGIVWRDDSIELLVLVGNNWDKMAHIIINSAGVVYDAIGLDPENSEWESGTQVAVSKDTSGYIIELGIPLAKLDTQKNFNQSWKINFYRNRVLKKAEYSSWSFCPGPFKNPTRLGQLMFQESVPQLELPNRVDLGLGYNEFEYQLVNLPNNKTYHLQVESLTRFDNNPIADITLPPNESIKKKLEFPLEVFEDGVQVTILDDSSNPDEFSERETGTGKKEPIYRTVYPLILKPESTAGNLFLQLASFIELLKNPNTPTGISTELKSTLQEVDAITHELKYASDSAYQKKQQVSHDEWARISPKLNAVYRKLNNYQTIVWQKGIWENLFPDELPDSFIEVKDINLLAMQDEYISTAINITNISFLPYSARVLIDKLSGKNDTGDSISFPRDNITIRRVVYRQLKNGITTGDALPEIDQAHLVDIPASKSGQVWFTIKTQGVAAGKYTGLIALKPLEDRMFSQKTVRLTITVLPIALPKEMPIATYLWDYATNDAYIRDLIDHKINKMLISCYICPPVCDSTGNVISIDYKKLDDAIAMKHKYGNEIMFSYGVVREFDRWAAKKNNWEYLSEPWKKAFASWITQWVKHLNELGLDYNDFSMQIWDEATGPNVKNVVEAGPFLRSIDPKIRWVMDGAQNLEEAKQMNPYVDIWIPHLDSLLRSAGKDALVAYYKSTGKPIWCYTCRVNMTSQPVLDYYRLKPWIAYQLGFDGVCFWAYNSWRGDPWSDFDVVGEEGYSDNGVVYSGDQGPIPSRRWEAFREGLQDYQYLYMLQQLIKQAEEESTVLGNDTLAKCAAEAKGVLTQAVDEVLSKQDEPTLYLWRQKIAEMILKLKKQSEVRSQ
jgi:hypothetical protein